MVGNSKGLGRGLEAMFQSSNLQPPLVGEGAAPTPYLVADADALVPNPDQPRRVFSQESLEELAASIRSQGLIQPIIARPGKESGRYEIIAGERRWRAAKMAGLKKIPVIVRELDNNSAMVTALMENLQRVDLNPLEMARGLQALKDALNVTQEALADRLGQNRATLANALRLLKLSPAAQEDVMAGALSASVARCLLSLGDENAAEELRQYIVEHSTSQKEAESIVRYWKENRKFPWQKQESEHGRPTPHDPQINALAKEIGIALNCPAKIRGSQDKGSITLSYGSNAQLFDLLDKLGLSLTN